MLITLARIWRKVGVKLAFLAVKFLCIGRGVTLNGNIGPLRRIFCVYFQPLIKAWFGVWLNRIGRAFRFAHATINAFVGMDNQHVFAFIEAIHRANFHAIHIFTFNAIFSDDVGHDFPVLLRWESHSGVKLRMHPLFRHLNLRITALHWGRALVFQPGPALLPL